MQGPEKATTEVEEDTITPVRMVEMMLQTEEQIKARYKRDVCLDAREHDQDIKIRTIKAVLNNLKRGLSEKQL